MITNTTKPESLSAQTAGTELSKIQVRYSGTNHCEWLPANRRGVALAPYEDLEGEEAFHAITQKNVAYGSRFDGGEVRPLRTFAIGEEVYVHDGEAFSFKSLDEIIWCRATILACR